MLRRSLRRRRSRSRCRSGSEENYIEHVISVWKNAAFQREHGEEKIQKLLNKLKKPEKESKSFNTKLERNLPSTSESEETDRRQPKPGSGEIKEHSVHEMTIEKMSVIKRPKYNTM